MADPMTNGTTAIHVHVSARTRERLGWNASNADMTFDEYVRRLIERDADRAIRPLTPEQKAARDAKFQEYVKKMQSRTPEEIEAAREEATVPQPPVYIPEGMTAAEYADHLGALAAAEPDDDTDEDVEDALRRLS